MKALSKQSMSYMLQCRSKVGYIHVIGSRYLFLSSEMAALRFGAYVLVEQLSWRSSESRQLDVDL